MPIALSVCREGASRTTASHCTFEFWLFLSVETTGATMRRTIAVVVNGRCR